MNFGHFFVANNYNKYQFHNLPNLMLGLRKEWRMRLFAIGFTIIYAIVFV